MSSTLQSSGSRSRSALTASFATTSPSSALGNHSLAQAAFGRRVRPCTLTFASQPRPALPTCANPALRAGRRLQTLVRRRTVCGCRRSLCNAGHRDPNAVDALALAAQNADRPSQQSPHCEGGLASFEQRRTAWVIHHVDIVRHVVV